MPTVAARGIRAKKIVIVHMLIGSHIQGGWGANPRTSLGGVLTVPVTLSMAAKKHPNSPYSTQLCVSGIYLINQAFTATWDSARSDLKSWAPQRAWGFDSPLGTNAINNLAQFLSSISSIQIGETYRELTVFSEKVDIETLLLNPICENSPQMNLLIFREIFAVPAMKFSSIDHGSG